MSKVFTLSKNERTRKRESKRQWQKERDWEKCGINNVYECQRYPQYFFTSSACSVFINVCNFSVLGRKKKTLKKVKYFYRRKSNEEENICISQHLFRCWQHNKKKKKNTNILLANQLDIYNMNDKKKVMISMRLFYAFCSH